MFILMSILIPLAVGASVMWAAHQWNLRDYSGNKRRITWPEFALGSAATIIVAFLVTVVVGPNMARDGAIKGYKEFYNGSVTRAHVVVDLCERDGSCTYTYRCDPYQVKVVDRSAYTDSNGVYHPEVSHWETRYHSCPYADRELDYVLDDSLDRTLPIGTNYFEANPREWRSGSGIPGEVPRQAPERWLRAKRNLENGMADPVTGVFEYANYILASDNDLYKEYDGAIATYQRARLLPEHTANLGDSMLYDFNMQARKIQAVGGLKVDNLSEWQDRLMRFNAALGSDLQGDMHVVLVPADKVTNPDEYITALKASWTSLGKWSISKNGIILAIGASSDGKTVEWARASTGMPVGNGEMVTALNLRLRGEPFDPDALFGNITTTVRKDRDKLKVTYDHSAGGMIGEIVFTDFPFSRACMKCEDASDRGVGYVDLKDLVPVTTGAKILMFFLVLFVSGVMWWMLLVFDPFSAYLPTRRKDGPTRPFGSY